MILVLDTNILQRDFRFESVSFQILRDYCQKTLTRIFLPQIVRDELLANYERALRQRVTSLEASLKDLKDIARPQLSGLSIPTLSVEETVAAYVVHLQRMLSPETYPPKAVYLERVLERSIKRLRPCSATGEEIRDAVIWESVKDIAREHPRENVVFITANNKQFGGPVQGLHPQLAAEVATEHMQIVYYAELGDFIKTHATRIDFITREWLQQSLDLNTVLDGVGESIEELVLKYAHRQSYGDDIRPTNYSRFISGDVALDDFYVYEMSDGSLRVEGMYSGEVEVEIEIEELEEEDTEPGRFTTVAKVDYVYPIAVLSVDLHVIDRTVQKWEVTSLDVSLRWPPR